MEKLERHEAFKLEDVVGVAVQGGVDVAKLRFDLAEDVGVGSIERSKTTQVHVTGRAEEIIKSGRRSWLLASASRRCM